ncbi:MAG: pyridoxal-phosphate dependent enzyme [Actinomycetota bacterium]
MALEHSVLGWRCRVCDTSVDIAEPEPWRCPRSTGSDRHHVLHPLVRPGVAPPPREFEHPFVRFEHRLAWAASAAARGMTSAARDALVTELDIAVERVDGVGFRVTPFGRSAALSDALGFGADAGVWVKDETGNVAGSQKARHLFSILLQLRANEALAGSSRNERAPLAIASCGNAALAAATLASAAEWPIDVYVPTSMSNGFGRELDRLGARVHRCERRAADPPGDPAMHRFREAVVDGATPFTVQGPENALCLDGGRTVGWEIAERLDATEGRVLDAIFVQVGGGAFASCLGAGLVEAGQRPALLAVQAEGCAPLDRAWRSGATERSAWSDAMPPWPNPHSLADGILDDETYDWIGVLDALRATGGDTVVAAEQRVERAWQVAGDAGFDCSPTGSAGLAGLLELLDGPDGDTWRSRSVGIVISGVRR